MRKMKQKLRDDIRKRLSQLSENDRATESRSLCRRLLELLPGDPAAICAYYPLRNEVDIQPLLSDLLGRKFQLFLPRFEGGALVFRSLQDLSGLQPGLLNTLEPSADAPLLDPKTLSHALIPGRAFDRSGNRLGRGNGGYDRWIAHQRSVNPRTVLFGICFECQLVREVPVEAHDQPVDAVVTARGIVEIGH